MDHLVVILVHYNTDKETRNCLESLRSVKTTRDFKFTVLVVDNGSKDFFKLKKSEESRNVQVVRSESNLGFTGGNNLGIWYAREHLQPNYVVLLNTDTTVHPEFLKEMYALAKTDDRIGAICPKIYFSKGREYHSSSYSSANKGNVLWYGGGSIDWKNLAAFHRGVDEIDRGQFDHTTETEFCTGCCIMLPLKVIEQVGTLDKRYFLYLEDVDLSLRIKAAGFSLRFCPTAKVWHVNAGSTGGSGSPIQQYYQTRNRLFFGWVHGDLQVKLITLRVAWQLLRSGSDIERRALFDVILGRMGKQPIH